MIDFELHACMRADKDKIKSLEQTVAELRAERDQMLCMLSKASDALRHSYNAVDWPADGTSRQEIVAGEINTMLAALASPPAAEESK